MQRFLLLVMLVINFKPKERKLIIKAVEKLLTSSSIFSLLRRRIAQSGEEEYTFTSNHPIAFEKGNRYEYRGVVFPIPFENIPSISVAISGIHSGGNNKIEISYDNVSLDSFSLVLRAWEDTSVYWINISWIAHL